MRAEWQTGRLKAALLSKYPSSAASALMGAVEAQQCKWRVNGSTHLELLAPDGRRLSLSMSSGAACPKNLGKLRSFLRRIGGLT